MITQIFFILTFTTFIAEYRGYDSCSTHSGGSGDCRPLGNCSSLYSIYIADKSPTAKKVIRSHGCKEYIRDRDQEFFVCCPQASEIRSCTDANEDPGECLPIESCPVLFKMAITRPILNSHRKFLARSQCDYSNGTPTVFVCCTHANITIEEKTRALPYIFNPTEETVMPPWLEVLKTLVPQPPHCGTSLMDKIFGGKFTVLGEFPWLVALEYRKPYNRINHHCGGSLINERFVLTAAHCIVSVPKVWELIKVRIGEWNTKTDPDCVMCTSLDCSTEQCAPKVIFNNITKKIVHPGYTEKNHFDDIALLRLEDKVHFNRYISPVCLPLDTLLRMKTFDRDIFTISGWGATESSLKSNMKMKATVPFKKKEDCGNIYEEKRKVISDNQICAGGEKGVDSCNGDSGGPLMHYEDNQAFPAWYAVGIVSYGAGSCGSENVSGIYTKVSKYLMWITQNLEP